MQKLPIYLDYMATTPIDKRVIQEMLKYMGVNSEYGNSSSLQHIYGQNAATAIDAARATIAATVGANSEDIIFTSGATEANNLAIIGAAKFYQRKGKHLITMTTEHKATLASFAELEKQGFTVTYLKPMHNGLLNLQTLVDSLRADTILVSIMHVNNEIGTIQDIAKIGELLNGKGVIFHVDAAQSAGRLAIDLTALNVNLMSFSAHKNYGPKGVGALYIQQRPRIRLAAQSFGGGQEKGMRSGTLPTHQIVGMATAFKISAEIRINEQAKIKKLRDELWQGIKNIPIIKLNCDFQHTIAGILNFSLREIDGEALIIALKPIAISSMSACAASSNKSSYVLKEIGLSEELAKSSIRICVGRYTSEKDIAKTIEIINKLSW